MKFEFLPLRHNQVPDAIQSSLSAKTWIPKSLGIIGTEQGNILMSKSVGGATILPTINLTRPGDRPEQSIVRLLPGAAITDVQFTNLVAYAPHPEQHDEKEFGSLFFLVAGTVPNLQEKKFSNQFELPASSILEKLSDEFQHCNYAGTALAISAIEAYRQQLRNTTA